MNIDWVAPVVMRVCITAAKQEEGQNIEGGMILLAHKDVDPVLTCTSCSLLNPTWTCFFCRDSHDPNSCL